MWPESMLSAARGIINGQTPELDWFQALARTPDEQVPGLLAGADLIRRRIFGNRVHLCSIINAKSGKCSEDCSFCAQSAHASTDAPVHGLVDDQQIRDCAMDAAQKGVHRFSVVTSGKGLSSGEVDRVAGVFSGLAGQGCELCASLGVLGSRDLDRLKDGGMTRYHHNLETARSFFPSVCTTHSYEDRVNTVRAAKEAGLSVCSGGLFGLGETDEQVLELALELRELDVDAVPVNFLVPIPGTPMAEAPGVTPLRGLKILALLRFVLPQKDILVCGGRESGLKTLHPLAFWAGASGVMTGNYLTTPGRSVEDDKKMLVDLGLTTR